MKKKGIIAIASTLTLAGIAAVSSVGIAVGSKKKTTTDNSGEPSINQTLYTVTFNTNGGVISNTEQQVTGGNTLTAPIVTKSGYEFLGWYSDEACTQKFDFEATPISGNITLYAKWGNKYTVNFNTLGGSDINPVRIAEGSPVTAPTAPTKTGFAFGGWYTDEACTNEYSFDAPVNAELTLYAKWEETFTVTYDACGGEFVAATNVVNGKKATEPVTTWEEYEFQGWYLDEGYTQPYNFETPVTSNITLFAKWEIDLNDLYDFELNGENYTLAKYKGNLTEITLPTMYHNKPVTAIGVGAFNNSNGYYLTMINVPESYQYINESGFRFCYNLNLIKLTNNIRRIDDCAFIYCNKLSSIVIPQSVEIMGASQFSYCENLEIIYCESNELPAGWESGWNNNVNFLLGSQWHYDENGNPVPNE